MQGYQSLIVWQKAMDLVTATYEATQSFPSEERFGLVSQMRRAAVSIPSNIAEGSFRRGKSNKEFFRIAYGSGAELETQLMISKRLAYIENELYDKVHNLLVEVMKMLNTLISKNSN